MRPASASGLFTIIIHTCYLLSCKAPKAICCAKKPGTIFYNHENDRQKGMPRDLILSGYAAIATPFFYTLVFHHEIGAGLKIICVVVLHRSRLKKIIFLLLKKQTVA